MTVLELGFWCRLNFFPKVKHIYNTDKNSLKLCQLILKMTEKRTPPVGAFKLNPLKVTSTTERHMSVDDSPKSCDEKDGNVGMAEDAEMKLKPEQGVKTIESVLEDATEGRDIKMDDSAVMMKMVISGPPSQAKKQRVLPESLLQKVTEIVRQQTGSHHDQDSVNQAAVPQDTSSPCSLSASSISEKSLNKDMVIVQPATQSLDNGNKERTITVSQCTETKNMSNDNKSSTSVESGELSSCLSCSSLNHDMETNECISKTVETSAKSVLKTETDMDLDSSEGIKEICGPPDSFIMNEMDTEIVIKTEMEFEPGACLNKTHEIDPSSASNAETDMDLDSGQVIKVVSGSPDSIKRDLEMVEKKETVLDVDTTETETDPFGGLLLDDIDEETGSDKAKTVKETDEVYNIAPLFTGELEKWRKREMKKEKKKSFKKPKKSGSHLVEDAAGKSGEKDEGERQKERRLVPNYFVAIQITDPKIHNGLKHVQEDVITGNEKLKPALNKLATLHLTMFVVHLNSENEMSRAREALNQCQKKLEPLYKQQLLSIDVSGLGNFRNNIVFAKVKSGDQIAKLKEIADVVEDCFLDQEIVSTEKSSSFKPHITVMKLTRDKSFRKKGGIKKIDEALYKDHIDKEFGRQYINTLQLCAMLKKKAESGYYQVEHSVQFGPDISENITDSPIQNGKDVLMDLDTPLTDTDDAAKAAVQKSIFANDKPKLGSCSVATEPSTDTDNADKADEQQTKSEILKTREESNYRFGNEIADTETPSIDIFESDDSKVQASVQSAVSENWKDTVIVKDGSDSRSADKETPSINTAVPKLKGTGKYESGTTEQGALVLGDDIDMQCYDSPSKNSDSGLDLEDSVSFDTLINSGGADIDMDTSKNITGTAVLEETKDLEVNISTYTASKDLEDIVSADLATNDSEVIISAETTPIDSSETVAHEETMDTDKRALSDKLEDSGIDSSAYTTYENENM